VNVFVRLIVSMFFFIASPLVVNATEVAINELLRAVGMTETLQIMRAEGLEYGETLGKDMLGANVNATWSEDVSKLYDPQTIADIVRRGFATAFGDTDTKDLLEFFNSSLGRQIVALELGARRAMDDDTVEAAAREVYLETFGTDDPKLKLVEDYIITNDLIEFNVIGALQANLMFFRGLGQGKALEMAEDEMTSEVWAQETDIRHETQEWLYSYLLMAFQPLSIDQLSAYLDLSKTPEGQILNKALFAGYDAMYSDVSFGLGLAMARQMNSQDL